ncbi:MAG: tRNA (adenosine(37)-N6)-dimethylallyltransferase MiaA [Halobacteriovoraceae bacterium]|nr:tRNA (adenosine(37)-N6)-dimethylallyltransferase MiaA [Halobacteriovoraceae bacterium]
MKKIIIISGPTACGKTNASLHLADYLLKKGKEISIVNFDSLLFYRELNIGTAKPDIKQRKSIEHHLIDIASIKNPINASLFIKLAVPLINELHKKNKIIILIGGSGFYLRALFKGMYPAVTQEEIRNELIDIYRKRGINSIHKILAKKDPVSFKNIHPNDHYRIIRATEYHLSSGECISQQKQKMNERSPYDLNKNIHSNWNFNHCYLDIPKEEHSNIINKRTQNIIEKGLIEEVTLLLNKGFTGLERPLQSIGHKQALDFINGKLSQENLVNEINLRTRRLAKAQRTFFKKIITKKEYHGIKDIKKIVKDNFEFVG